MNTCRAIGCERAMYVRGVCRMHYRRLLETGDIEAPTTRRDYVVSEVEFMAGWRESDDLARALGYRDGEYLADALRRWGRGDLADRVTGRRAA